MNDTLAGAIGELRRRGVLDGPTADFLERIARRELVSVRLELRLLLAVGVMLAGAGVGLLVKEHYRLVGPLGVAAGILAGVVLCFWYVRRHAPPFSREEVSPPTLAFPYVLLLGALLTGSELAWLETQFTLLGAAWPWHLLVCSLIYLALAYRHDATSLLTLALTTFAAWRGVAVSFDHLLPHGAQAPLVRLNSLVVGALFLAGALVSALSGRKRHFEPVYAVGGLVLVLGALVEGAYEVKGAWTVAALLVSGATIVAALRLRRTLYFALGTVAAWLVLLHLITELRGFGAEILYLVSATALGVMALVAWAHRHFRENG